MLCKLSKLSPDSIVLIPPAVLARTTHPRQWLVDLIEYHLWQLTHTVALVMYSFLEVYFMSFSSAGNADVFGLHIGLLVPLVAAGVSLGSSGRANRHQRCWCVYWSNYSSQSAASPDTHRPFIPGETSAIPDVFVKSLLPFLVCRMYVDKP